jgi:hypothetical protein
VVVVDATGDIDAVGASIADIVDRRLALDEPLAPRARSNG